jgi:hypothetical protein
MTQQDHASGTATAASSAMKDVAAETRHQAADVAGTASAELRSTAMRLRGELRGQAVQQTDRVGAGLRQLSDQLQAFARGDREAAGPVGGYVDDAGTRLRSIADRVEREGFDGVVYDLRQVARRRPGMFLLGAAAAGFAAGRMMRSGMAVANGNGHDEHELDRSAAAMAIPTPEAAVAAGAAAPGTAGAAYPTDVTPTPLGARPTTGMTP